MMRMSEEEEDVLRLHLNVACPFPTAVDPVEDLNPPNSNSSAKVDSKPGCRLLIRVAKVNVFALIIMIFSRKWHKFCIYGDVFYIKHMPNVENFRFFHICHGETSEISPYVEKF